MQYSPERRGVPRTDAVLRVECLDGSAIMYAQNVGSGGMAVTSTVPRWPGTLIRVRFTPPGTARAIRATVRVVDLVQVPRGVGMAVQFLLLAPEARLILERYVQRVCDANERFAKVPPVDARAGVGDEVHPQSDPVAA